MRPLKQVITILALAAAFLLPGSHDASAGRGSNAAARGVKGKPGRPARARRGPLTSTDAIVRHMGKRGIPAADARARLFQNTGITGGSTVFFNAAGVRQNSGGLAPSFVDVSGIARRSTTTRTGWTIRMNVRSAGQQLEPLDGAAAR